jgi:hypothetical protein
VSYVFQKKCVKRWLETNILSLNFTIQFMSNPTTNTPLSKLNVLRFDGVQMRTFHITWLTFFVCFFGWFGLAPLMPTIREDLGLTSRYNFKIHIIRGRLIFNRNKTFIIS